MVDTPIPSLEQALALHRAGDLNAAAKLYEAILEQQPRQPEALQLLGAVRGQQGDAAAAVPLLQQAIALGNALPEVHNNLGNALHSVGRSEEALDAFRQAIALRPSYEQAYRNLAKVLRQLDRPEAVLACYEQAVAELPQSPGLQSSLGSALLDLDRPAEALAAFDAALAIEPGRLNAWINRGNALAALQRIDAALSSYERALALDPNDSRALVNRGNVLLRLHQLPQALACYQQALIAEPGSAEAHNGRGVVLSSLQRSQEALEALDRALTLRPDYPDALYNRGDVLQLARRFSAAAEAYGRAHQLAPSTHYVPGAIYDCQQHICAWGQREQRRAEILAGLQRGEAVCSPFVFLSLSDSPEDQLRCAAIYAADRCPPATPLWQGERYSHERIRVAYLSADFHSHATAFLMAELFEIHDRSRFELYGVCFGPRRSDAMRQRVEQAFDHFFDVGSSTDLEVAQLLRQHEIDIAIDLKGFTQHCRPRILTHRPAPVQVNYLGFPGSMAAPFIDYILADAVVIPPEHEPFYSEQVVRLPHCYQVNDRHRLIADHTPSHAELGLPEQGFVFCCFNNNYKITPELFAIWMRLLHAVPGSVLWLLEDNPEASANLRREASDRGVDPGRLAFAPRAALPEHLARHRRADLFLDTLPVNAHTTASDALWAGLPVLTCLGQSFAARVAASLLQAIELPELITESLEAYEARALELAHNPAELAALRQRLERNRLTTPLFDTDRFRRDLEAALAAMHQRAQQELPPPADPEELFREGTALLRQQQFAPALERLQQAAALRPDHAPTHCNIAAAQLELGCPSEARSAGERAVQLAPDFADAWNNLGSALMKQRQPEKALQAYEQACRLQPDQASFHNNRGVALSGLNRQGEAAQAYSRVWQLDPHYRGIHSAMLFAMRNACIWPDPSDSADPQAQAERDCLEQAQQGERVFAPFVFLALCDDPARQLAVAKSYVRHKHPPAATQLWQGERYSHGRIRVAYLSADFHSHATAFLMAELFELHDRQQFEWWGVSFGPPERSPMRKRLEQAFDHFLEVRDRSDLEVAQQLRALEIDIAVDLKGFTRECRPGILAHRPAPLQVSYLGYPGSMGAPYIDAIIADAVVIPPEHEPFYSEQVVRLPHCYQVNDRHRVIAEHTPNRQELGLPEQGFVFCCFNNNYKLTPAFFDIWMRLLQAVPGSVLWLLESNNESATHLRSQAQKRGIASDRLVFAPKLPLPEHLARHRCADLFLDTLPVNAHTTASDALWAGLPVLSCQGHSFAGRVAASLLQAIELPELITESLEAYEARALELAHNPTELATLRQRLERNRLTTPLFDTDRFRRDLEAAYLSLHQQHQSAKQSLPSELGLGQ